jgi:hypothetical protein
MKKQWICVLGLIGLCVSHTIANDVATEIETEGERFEQQTRKTLEAAKTKTWWGYYDFPRLSLKIFARSAPNVELYFKNRPDRFLALKLDALLTVDGLRDKTYELEKVPKEDQGLLFNGNTHMALLKKEKENEDSLTEKERSQLKFIREYDLDKAYRAYLEQCQISFRESDTTTISGLMHVLMLKIKDNALRESVWPDIRTVLTTEEK